MKLDITLEDAFETGHLQGTKEVLREILNVCDIDPSAVRTYATARLRSLEQVTEMPRRLKDVSYNPRSLSGFRVDAPSGRDGDET